MFIKSEEHKKALSLEVERYKLLIPEVQKESKMLKGTREEKLAITKLRKTKEKLEQASADLSKAKMELGRFKN